MPRGVLAARATARRRARSEVTMTTPTPKDIRRARECAGLTQTAAARLIYSTLRTWQGWELGERRMHPAFFELFTTKTTQPTNQTEASTDHE